MPLKIFNSERVGEFGVTIPTLSAFTLVGVLGQPRVEIILGLIPLRIFNSERVGEFGVTIPTLSAFYFCGILNTQG
jgi:hypothetical protein